MALARRATGTRTVGRTLAHDSAALHVQGSAAYVDDMREPEGLLHVYPGFARQGALGAITRLDLAAARAAPGVVAVLTAKDIPGINDCAPVFGGDPILADGRIMFHGQVVFAVVAETREAARRAARLAVVEVTAERPAVTVEDALAMATRDVGEPYQFRRRDPGKAISAAPHRVE
jgi:xanthine dehydrogenase large subunit